MKIISIPVRPQQLLAAMLAAVLPVILIGCGKSQAPAHPVSGKVIHDGKPVTGGGFTFTPVAEGNEAVGSPVIAVIESDGSVKFEAPEGTYQVLFSPPSTGDAAEPAEGEHVDPCKQPQSPYEGLAPKDKEIKVSTGENSITIELIPAE
jgi:hypothetical protein